MITCSVPNLSLGEILYLKAEGYFNVIYIMGIVGLRC